ncbi:MAG TPA: lipid II flippase MurJ [Candidatus Paceibacterota bacterium]|nr:lipid II flippase MurJ [Candidatus Paceibacterota bacterium]
MVKKFLGMFHREIGSLHEAAYLLASFSLLSQILAVVRDRLLAHNFGAGQTLDIYYAAFRIPDLIYVSIASFVAVTILIPFLLEKLGKSDHEAFIFIDAVFTVFLLVIFAVCAVAFFLMPFLAHIVAPGFEGEAKHTFVFMARVLLLSPILLGISNLLGSITQLYKKFFVFALSPVLYNAGIIVGLLFFEPKLGLFGVVLGVVLGAAMHMSIQLPVVERSGIAPRGKFLFRAFRTPETIADLKRLVRTSIPRTISLSLTQIVTLVLVSVASILSPGAISIFSLSNNLQSVPLAVIGMSYSVAAFPMLASYFSSGKQDKFKAQLLSATKHILFWSLPAAALFIVLRAQIVRVLYGSGAFTWADTRLTAAALGLFALSVTAQSLVLLYARGYYAAGNTSRPLSINAFSSALIIVLAAVLVPLFHHAEGFRFFFENLLRVDDLPGTTILMLPLSFSIGMIVNASLLIYFFKKDFGLSFASIQKSFHHGIYGALFMGFVAYQFLDFLDDFFNLNTFMGIFLQGLIAGVAGIIAGIALLWVLDNDEIKVVARTLHAKFWKTKTVASSQDEL